MSMYHAGLSVFLCLCGVMKSWTSFSATNLKFDDGASGYHFDKTRALEGARPQGPDLGSTTMSSYGENRDRTSTAFSPSHLDAALQAYDGHRFDEGFAAEGAYSQSPVFPKHAMGCDSSSYDPLMVGSLSNSKDEVLSLDFDDFSMGNCAAEGEDPQGPVLMECSVWSTVARWWRKFCSRISSWNVCLCVMHCFPDETFSLLPPHPDFSILLGSLLSLILFFPLTAVIRALLGKRETRNGCEIQSFFTRTRLDGYRFDKKRALEGARPQGPDLGSKTRSSFGESRDRTSTALSLPNLDEALPAYDGHRFGEDFASEGAYSQSPVFPKHTMGCDDSSYDRLLAASLSNSKDGVLSSDRGFSSKGNCATEGEDPQGPVLIDNSTWSGIARWWRKFCSGISSRDVCLCVMHNLPDETFSFLPLHPDIPILAGSILSLTLLFPLTAVARALLERREPESGREIWSFFMRSLADGLLSVFGAFPRQLLLGLPPNWRPFQGPHSCFANGAPPTGYDVNVVDVPLAGGRDSAFELSRALVLEKACIRHMAAGQPAVTSALKSSRARTRGWRSPQGPRSLFAPMLLSSLCCTQGLHSCFANGAPPTGCDDVGQDRILAVPFAITKDGALPTDIGHYSDEDCAAEGVDPQGPVLVCCVTWSGNSRWWKEFCTGDFSHEDCCRFMHDSLLEYLSYFPLHPQTLILIGSSLSLLWHLTLTAVAFVSLGNTMLRCCCEIGSFLLRLPPEGLLFVRCAVWRQLNKGLPEDWRSLQGPHSCFANGEPLAGWDMSVFDAMPEGGRDRAFESSRASVLDKACRRDTAMGRLAATVTKAQISSRTCLRGRRTPQGPRSYPSRLLPLLQVYPTEAHNYNKGRLEVHSCSDNVDAFLGTSCFNDGNLDPEAAPVETHTSQTVSLESALGLTMQRNVPISTDNLQVRCYNRLCTDLDGSYGPGEGEPDAGDSGASVYFTPVTPDVAEAANWLSFQAYKSGSDADGAEEPRKLEDAGREIMMPGVEIQQITAHCTYASACSPQAECVRGSETRALDKTAEVRLAPYCASYDLRVSLLASQPGFEAASADLLLGPDGWLTILDMPAVRTGSICHLCVNGDGPWPFQEGDACCDIHASSVQPQTAAVTGSSESRGLLLTCEPPDNCNSRAQVRSTRDCALLPEPLFAPAGELTRDNKRGWLANVPILGLAAGQTYRLCADFDGGLAELPLGNSGFTRYVSVSSVSSSAIRPLSSTRASFMPTRVEDAGCSSSSQGLLAEVCDWNLTAPNDTAPGHLSRASTTSCTFALDFTSLAIETVYRLCLDQEGDKQAGLVVLTDPDLHVLGAAYSVAGCVAFCNLPSTAGFDFSGHGGTLTILGFSPSGVLCAHGYAGTVAYSPCSVAGTAHTVTGCEAACSVPSKTCYDFSSAGGIVTTSGFAPSGVICASDYTGSVIYSECGFAGAVYSVSGCEPACRVPSTTGDDFSSAGGTLTISGFAANGVSCARGCSGTVTYTACTSAGNACSVSGCRAACSVPASAGFGFSSAGGTLTIDGFAPNGFKYAIGYTGAVSYSACGSAGAEYFVSGCAEAKVVSGSSDLDLESTQCSAFVSDSNSEAHVGSALAQSFSKVANRPKSQDFPANPQSWMVTADEIAVSFACAFGDSSDFVRVNCQVTATPGRRPRQRLSSSVSDLASILKGSDFASEFSSALTAETSGALSVAVNTFALPVATLEPSYIVASANQVLTLTCDGVCGPLAVHIAVFCHDQASLPTEVPGDPARIGVANAVASGTSATLRLDASTLRTGRVFAVRANYGQRVYVAEATDAGPKQLRTTPAENLSFSCEICSEQPERGPVRPTGNTAWAGRLETYRDGKGGSVCERNSSDVKAQAVGRQLSLLSGTALGPAGAPKSVARAISFGDFAASILGWVIFDNRFETSDPRGRNDPGPLGWVRVRGGECSRGSPAPHLCKYGLNRDEEHLSYAVCLRGARGQRFLQRPHSVSVLLTLWVGLLLVRPSHGLGSDSHLRGNEALGFTEHPLALMSVFSLLRVSHAVGSIVSVGVTLILAFRALVAICDRSAGVLFCQKLDLDIEPTNPQEAEKSRLLGALSSDRGKPSWFTGPVTHQVIEEQARPTPGASNNNQIARSCSPSFCDSSVTGAGIRTQRGHGDSCTRKLASHMGDQNPKLPAAHQGICSGDFANSILGWVISLTMFKTRAPRGCSNRSPLFCMHTRSGGRACGSLRPRLGKPRLDKDEEHISDGRRERRTPQGPRSVSALFRLLVGLLFVRSSYATDSDSWLQDYEALEPMEHPLILMLWGRSTTTTTLAWPLDKDIPETKMSFWNDFGQAPTLELTSEPDFLYFGEGNPYLLYPLFGGSAASSAHIRPPTTESPSMRTSLWPSSWSQPVTDPSLPSTGISLLTSGETGPPEQRLVEDHPKGSRKRDYSEQFSPDPVLAWLLDVSLLCCVRMLLFRMLLSGFVTTAAKPREYVGSCRPGPLNTTIGKTEGGSYRGHPGQTRGTESRLPQTEGCKDPAARRHFMNGSRISGESSSRLFTQSGGGRVDIEAAPELGTSYDDNKTDYISTQGRGDTEAAPELGNRLTRDEAIRAQVHRPLDSRGKPIRWGAISHAGCTLSSWDSQSSSWSHATSDPYFADVAADSQASRWSRAAKNHQRIHFAGADVDFQSPSQNHAAAERAAQTRERGLVPATHLREAIHQRFVASLVESTMDSQGPRQSSTVAGFRGTRFTDVAPERPRGTPKGVPGGKDLTAGNFISKCPASEHPEKAVRPEAEATVSRTCPITISGRMRTYLYNTAAEASHIGQDPQSAMQNALEKASSEDNAELAIEAASLLARRRKTAALPHCPSSPPTEHTSRDMHTCGEIQEYSEGSTPGVVDPQGPLPVAATLRCPGPLQISSAFDSTSRAAGRLASLATAPAVCGPAGLGNRELSYKDRPDPAYSIALKLGDRLPDSYVGRLLPCDVDSVVCQLGILISGVVYLPLFSAVPEERISYIWEDSACDAVITNKADSPALGSFSGTSVFFSGIRRMNRGNGRMVQLAVTVRVSNLAHAIPISGTAGKPKGEGVVHPGVSNLLQPHREQASRNGQKQLEECVLAAAFIFDSFIREISGPTRVRKLYQLGQIVNVYGLPGSIAECTIHLADPNTSYEVLPVGKHIANVNSYAVNVGTLQVVNKGEQGELWVNVPGIARGYRNRKEFNPNKFVTDPSLGGGETPTTPRLFRTGDLVRWTEPGDIESLGRTDPQVKTRGYRIELEEVERVRAETPGVRIACVLVTKSLRDPDEIVIYVEPPPDNTEGVRNHCGSKMPACTVPKKAVSVDALEPTRYAKIDKKRLPPVRWEVFPVSADNLALPVRRMELQIVDLREKAFGEQFSTDVEANASTPDVTPERLQQVGACSQVLAAPAHGDKTSEGSNAAPTKLKFPPGHAKVSDSEAAATASRNNKFVLRCLNVCGAVPGKVRLALAVVGIVGLWLMPGAHWLIELGKGPPVVPFDPVLKHVTTTTTTTICNRTEGFLTYNETNDTYSCVEQCPVGYTPLVRKTNTSGNLSFRECWAVAGSNPIELGLPFMESSYPQSGMTNVPVFAQIQFVFNVPVELADPTLKITLTPLFSALPLISIPVAGASISNRTVTVSLPELLERGTTYEVNVLPGARQSSGEVPMPSMEIASFFFTTVKAAKVAKAELNITLEGLDFFKLMESPEKAQEIRETMASQAALQVGVPVNMVRVTLAPGSVIAKTTILTKNASAAKQHLEHMQDPGNQSSMMARISEELQEIDMTDIVLPGRKLQIGVSVSEVVEETNDGFPKLLRWSPPVDVEVFSLHERIEVTFSVPVQTGNAKVILFQAGQSNGYELVSEAVVGSTLTVVLPALRLVPGSLYSLVLEPGCVMSLAGFGFEGVVRDFYVEGPQSNGSTWSCGLAESRTMHVNGLARGSLSENLLSESRVAVVNSGWCSKAGFSHPDGKGPFPEYWTDRNVDGNGSSRYNVGTSLLAHPDIYDLCCRPTKNVSYAVLFGTVSLSGPREMSASCMLGSSCSTSISGHQIQGGSLGMHSSTAGPAASDCKSKALVAVQIMPAPPSTSLNVLLGSHISTLKAGTSYALCWSPLPIYSAPQVFIGVLQISGPLTITDSKGSRLAPAAFASFQLHISGHGFRSGGEVQLIAGKAHNCELMVLRDQSNLTGSALQLLGVNSKLANFMPLTGWTGSPQKSKRWRVGALDPGDHSVCWCGNISACSVPGGILVGSFSVHEPVCGDGKREGLEDCDDGITDPLDGCSGTCQPESGYSCRTRVGIPDLCEELVDASEEAEVNVTSSAENADRGQLVDGTVRTWFADGPNASVTLKLKGAHQLRSLLLDLPPMGANQRIAVTIRAFAGNVWTLLSALSLIRPDGVSSAQSMQAEPVAADAVQVEQQVNATAGQLPAAGTKAYYDASVHRLEVDIPPDSVIGSLVMFELSSSLANGRRLQEDGSANRVGLREVSVVGVRQLPNCSSILPDSCAELFREACEEGFIDQSCGPCLVGFQGETLPSQASCVVASPRECDVSEWEDWQACSKTCGAGWQIRQREVLQYPQAGAEPCEALEDRLACNSGQCSAALPPLCSANDTNGTAEDTLASPILPSSRRLAQESKSAQRRSSPQGRPKHVWRRLSDLPPEEWAHRERRLSSAPAEVQQLTAGFQAVPGVQISVRDANSPPVETSCSLSAQGTEVVIPMLDVQKTDGAAKRQCPVRFYTANVVSVCIDDSSCPQQNQDQDLQPGCYLKFCCEPCIEKCQVCNGAKMEQCVKCKPGFLLFFHESGRPQCIKEDTCMKMGCYLPTPEGRCLPDTKSQACLHGLDDEDDSQTVSELEPDEDDCSLPTVTEIVPKSCSEEPSNACSPVNRELCFYDETCSQTDAKESMLIGCEATGLPNCRFCGFASYSACPGVIPTAGRRLGRSRRARRLAGKSKLGGEEFGCSDQRKGLNYKASDAAAQSTKGFGRKQVIEFITPHVTTFFMDKIYAPTVGVYQTAGAQFAVLDTCGVEDAGINGAYLSRSLATFAAVAVSASGAAVTWTDGAPVSAAGGSYWLRWCAGGHACGIADEFVGVGRFTLIGPAPLQQDRTCVAGLGCEVDSVTGQGLPSNGRCFILYTCGKHQLIIDSDDGDPRNASDTNGPGLSGVAWGVAGTRVCWGGLTISAEGGQYRLCWCLPSPGFAGNINDSLGGSHMGPVATNTTTFSRNFFCGTADAFRVDVGRLTLMGPLKGQPLTCISGRTCTVDSLEVWHPCPDDQLIVMDTCGKPGPGDALVHVPMTLKTTRSYANTVGTSAFAWGSTDVLVKGGNYRPCWCSARAVQPGNWSACTDGPNYNVDAGTLQIIGPAPLVQDRTCVSGQTCAIDGLTGVPPGVDWLFMALDTCAPPRRDSNLTGGHASPGFPSKGRASAFTVTTFPNASGQSLAGVSATWSSAPVTAAMGRSSFQVSVACADGYDGQPMSTVCEGMNLEYLLHGCSIRTRCSAPANTLGYIISEDNLQMPGFSVVAKCTLTYTGAAVDTECDDQDPAYKLSGCVPIECKTPASTEGYVISEVSTNASSFRINATCASSYKGMAHAYPCTENLQEHTLTGCFAKKCTQPDSGALYGYQVISEISLDMPTIEVEVRCAEGYEGNATVGACTNDLQPYLLSGCSPAECLPAVGVDGYELNVLSLVKNNFAVNASCAWGYHGIAVATVCSQHNRAYSLSGCRVVGGLYRLCWCSATAGSPGVNGRSANATAARDIPDSWCSSARHFRLNMGAFNPIGPPAGPRAADTCVSGRARSLHGDIIAGGLPLGAGDRLVALDTCGPSGSVLPRFGWSAVASASGKSCAHISGGISIITALGGRYRLCWCSGSSIPTEGANLTNATLTSTSGCSTGERFRMDVGDLEIVRPARIAHRTCVSGSICNYDGPGIWGLSDYDQIMDLDTCRENQATIPRMAHDGCALDVFASGGAVTWGGAAVTTAGGLYRLCWCGGFKSNSTDANPAKFGDIACTKAKAGDLLRRAGDCQCFSWRPAAVDFQGVHFAVLDFPWASPINTYKCPFSDDRGEFQISAAAGPQEVPFADEAMYSRRLDPSYAAADFQRAYLASVAMVSKQRQAAADLRRTRFTEAAVDSQSRALGRGWSHVTADLQRFHLAHAAVDFRSPGWSNTAADTQRVYFANASADPQGPSRRHAAAHLQGFHFANAAAGIMSRSRDQLAVNPRRVRHRNEVAQGQHKSDGLGGFRPPDLRVVSALKILWRHFPHRFDGGTDADDLLLRDFDDRLLSRETVQATLQTSARQLGIKADIGSHSLRFGGASALWAAYHDSALVRRWGRWASDSFQTYIWEAREGARGVAEKMANADLTQT